MAIVGRGQAGTSAIEISTSETESYLISKEQIQQAVDGCKVDITVINTGCFSGQRANSSWKLSALAQSNELAFSFPSLPSGHLRGGIFTAALIAEHADEFTIRAPCPGPAFMTKKIMTSTLIAYLGRSFTSARKHMKKSSALAVLCEYGSTNHQDMNNTFVSLAATRPCPTICHSNRCILGHPPCT